jgi:hypothetical protein
MRKKRVWPREFVKVWQSASSTTDVAEKLNMTARAVGQRAKRYRANGVRLKVLPAVESWEWLADYAERL